MAHAEPTMPFSVVQVFLLPNSSHILVQSCDPNSSPPAYCLYTINARKLLPLCLVSIYVFLRFRHRCASCLPRCYNCWSRLAGLLSCCFSVNCVSNNHEPGTLCNTSRSLRDDMVVVAMMEIPTVMRVFCECNSGDGNRFPTTLRWVPLLVIWPPSSRAGGRAHLALRLLSTLPPHSHA
ncbi:hypothetical protein EJ03DRAFT_32004 [Teratosphaeria nubilosa]|uniref:Uncharacterized protein n=1 Tax=Teratosphaeria nubilosa TaxID=161662 RepID=A0A6G1KUM5_9PEZI|nr:hypothetical protein EJ03DRAFT_32004 [Teratosphaeria nubilosa]